MPLTQPSPELDPEALNEAGWMWRLFRKRLALAVARSASGGMRWMKALRRLSIWIDPDHVDLLPIVVTAPETEA